MVKKGDKIEILSMDGEPHYAGKQGVVEEIDSIGQLHGTWGGLAVSLKCDRVKVVKSREQLAGEVDSMENSKETGDNLVRYKLKLPIGDWSRDGHNECEYYQASSAKPIDEVREAHFKIEEVTGINIETVAGEYDEPWIEPDNVKKLIDVGFYRYMIDVEGYSHIEQYIENLRDGERDCGVDSTTMAHLWVFLLNKVNPELKLELEKPTEMIPFYGYDEKGRHIGQVGYGLF